MTKLTKKLMTMFMFLTVCTPALTVFAHADAIVVEEEWTVSLTPLLCASILIIVVAGLTVILRRRGKK